MIYLVEDDKSNRELVLYTLKATGFEAVGFERGEALWCALEQSLPNLILLDIMLPGEDGLTILKKLKASPQTCRIPGRQKPVCYAGDYADRQGQRI